MKPILTIGILVLLLIASCNKQQPQQEHECGSTIVKGERCYFKIPIDEIIKEMFKDVEPTIIVWDTYYNSSDLINVSCFEAYNKTNISCPC